MVGLAVAVLVGGCASGGRDAMPGPSGWGQRHTFGDGAQVEVGAPQVCVSLRGLRAVQVRVWLSNPTRVAVESPPAVTARWDGVVMPAVLDRSGPCAAARPATGPVMAGGDVVGVFVFAVGPRTGVLEVSVWLPGRVGAAVFRGEVAGAGIG